MADSFRTHAGLPSSKRQERWLADPGPADGGYRRGEGEGLSGPQRSRAGLRAPRRTSAPRFVPSSHGVRRREVQDGSVVHPGLLFPIGSRAGSRPQSKRLAEGSSRTRERFVLKIDVKWPLRSSRLSRPLDGTADLTRPGNLFWAPSSEEMSIDNPSVGRGTKSAAPGQSSKSELIVDRRLFPASGQLPPRDDDETGRFSVGKGE